MTFRFLSQLISTSCFLLGASVMAARASAQDDPGPAQRERAGQAIRIQLAPSQEPDMEVSVVDPEGHPVELSSEVGQWIGRQVPRGWPTRPRVFVLPVADSAQGDSPSRLLRTGECSSPGKLRFELAPGKDYLAVLLAPGAPASFELFHFGSRGEYPELWLQRPAPGPMGSVTVDVRNPDGSAHHSDISIFVLDRERGVPLVGRESGWSLLDPLQEPGLPRFTLPVGEYVLSAREEPYRDYHGRVHSGRKHGDARVPFTIAEGISEELVVPLTVGAFLEVELEGLVSSRDYEVVHSAFEGSGMSSFVPHEELAQRARLTLQRPAAYPVPVEFTTFTQKNSSGAGMHIVSWMQLGTHATSEALSAGHYRLEARLPGGRLLARDVELKSGQTLKLKLDF